MIECPYCGKEIEEPDECPDPRERYEHQCPECEKNFTFTIDYRKDFYPDKADCLNGAPHDYQPTNGAPDWWFKGKRRCPMCQKQIEIEPPIMPEKG